MDRGLKDRVALVTGGSRGIGRACAIALAKAGCDVAVSARGAEALAEVAEAVRATGRRCLTFSADMGSAEACRAFVERAAAEFGRVDVLVNSVGSAPPGGIETLSDEQWLGAFNLKVMSFLRCTRAALPYMRRQRWGRIINIAGTAGKEPDSLLMSAGMANAAMLNLTRSLAEALAPDNILVNAVSPGPTRTDRWGGLRRAVAQQRGIGEEEAERELIRSIPIGRIAEPDEVAAVVVFLASEEARFITGRDFPVDGGLLKGI